MFNPIKFYEDGKDRIQTSLTTRNIILNYQIGNDTSYPNAGTTVYDITANSNNATINGGVIYEKINEKEVLTSNGVNGYILPPTSTAKSDTDSFSITTWCVPRTGGFGSMFNRGNDGFGGGWSIQLSLNTSSISFSICLAPGTSYNISPTVPIQANKFYHIAGVYSRTEGKYRIYLNGVFITEGTLPANGTLRSSTRGFVLGVSKPLGYWAANSVSEVQFYNTALTEEEVKNNYLYGIKTYNY